MVWLCLILQFIDLASFSSWYLVLEMERYYIYDQATNFFKHVFVLVSPSPAFVQKEDLVLMHSLRISVVFSAAFSATTE